MPYKLSAIVVPPEQAGGRLPQEAPKFGMPGDWERLGLLCLASHMMLSFTFSCIDLSRYPVESSAVVLWAQVPRRPRLVLHVRMRHARSFSS